MVSSVSTRSEGFTESVIREMTRLALAHDAVNLAQGFPDFDSPKEMLNAAIRAIRDGKNQYAITWGTPGLRQAIAAKTKKFQKFDVNPEEEITVTCGSTEAMIASLLAIINPGDEVIIFEPFYENYGPDAILSNAIPRYVPMREPDPVSREGGMGSRGVWSFDFDLLSRAFNSRTKAIIINTPNNPTGKIFSREELQFIANLCQKWDVVAITDEIYEHILYEQEEHVSLAALPGMKERTITINAISKTYSATGWRVGWAIASSPLTGAIRKVHDFLTVGAPHPLQEAAAVALNLPDKYYDDLAADYAGRREFLVQELFKTGFKCWKPYGAYYVMTDFSSVKLSRGLSVQDDTEFARWLVQEIGIAAVPGSSFYREPSFGKTKLRFSFGRKMKVLKEAAKRLKKLR